MLCLTHLWQKAEKDDKWVNWIVFHSIQLIGRLLSSGIKFCLYFSPLIASWKIWSGPSFLLWAPPSFPLGLPPSFLSRNTGNEGHQNIWVLYYKNTFRREACKSFIYNSSNISPPKLSKQKIMVVLTNRSIAIGSQPAIFLSTFSRNAELTKLPN